MREKKGVYINGYVMFSIFMIFISIFFIGILGFAISASSIVPSIIGLIGALSLAPGFFIVKPNYAAALVLYGRYHGSARESGFHWTLPFYQKIKISLRLRNLNTEQMKVNDNRGNPIEISAVVVWKVKDTAQALFEVDKIESFIETQSESAIRHLATLYPYDSETETQQKSLRENVTEVNDSLSHQLKERFENAGIEVIEARINHLAYATEIAQIMLRRQAAEAVIGARHMLVDGAVGMVEMALEKLSKKHIVKLDENRKATMVSNLLVVLCGESEVQPVINTGSINS